MRLAGAIALALVLVCSSVLQTHQLLSSSVQEGAYDDD